MKSLFIRVTDLRGFHLNSAKFLTILTGKTVFYLVQYINGWLAASDLFDVFAQSVKFYYTFSILKRFQYFNFETDFLENENHFQKTAVQFFS